MLLGATVVAGLVLSDRSGARGTVGAGGRSPEREAGAVGEGAVVDPALAVPTVASETPTPIDGARQEQLLTRLVALSARIGDAEKVAKQTGNDVALEQARGAWRELEESLFGEDRRLYDWTGTVEGVSSMGGVVISPIAHLPALRAASMTISLLFRNPADGEWLLDSDTKEPLMEPAVVGALVKGQRVKFWVRFVGENPFIGMMNAFAPGQRVYRMGVGLGIRVVPDDTTRTAPGVEGGLDALFDAIREAAARLPSGFGDESWDQLVAPRLRAKYLNGWWDYDPAQAFELQLASYQKAGAGPVDALLALVDLVHRYADVHATAVSGRLGSVEVLHDASGVRVKALNPQLLCMGLAELTRGLRQIRHRAPDVADLARAEFAPDVLASRLRAVKNLAVAPPASAARASAR